MLTRAKFDEAVAALSEHGKVRVEIRRGDGGRAWWHGTLALRVAREAVADTVAKLAPVSRRFDGDLMAYDSPASVYLGGACVEVNVEGLLADPEVQS